MSGTDLSQSVVHSALGRVCGTPWVASVRADSPLPGPADAIAIAEAVQQAAAEHGLTIVLDDSDLADARTVADLVRTVTVRVVDARAVAAHAERGA